MWRPWFMLGGCLYRKQILNSIMGEKKMQLRHARQNDLQVKMKNMCSFMDKKKINPFLYKTLK